MTDGQDKSERIDSCTEERALSGKDADKARTAGAAELKKVESQRTNASDGSLAKFLPGKSDQDESIQIVFDDHVVSRNKQLSETDASSPEPSVKIKGIVHYNEPEISLLNKIAALPMEQQVQILAAGVRAFNQEMTAQQWQIAIGSVKGFGEAATSFAAGVEGTGKLVCDTASFCREVMLNDPACLDKAEAAGSAVGKLLVGGIHIFSACDIYLQSVGAAGANDDYGKVFRDIGWLGCRMNERWQAMSTEERSGMVSKLATENLGNLALGMGVNKLAKSMDVVGALEELGTSAGELGAGPRERSGKFIAGMIDQLAPRPMAVAPEGFLIPVDNSAESHILMMKGDKGLPAGVRPSELLEAKGKFTATGQVRFEADAPQKLLEAGEKSGFDRKFVEEQLTQVNRALNQAYLDIGAYDPAKHGTERAYGYLLHEQLRNEIELFQDPYLSAEVSYLKGDLSTWNKLGTSRIDIILVKPEQPYGSICLKTLGATPSAKQERGWIRNLPVLPDGGIVPRTYLKISVPKAFEKVPND